MSSRTPNRLPPLQTTSATPPVHDGTSYFSPNSPHHLSRPSPSVRSNSPNRLRHLLSQDSLLANLTPTSVAKMADDRELQFSPGEKEVGVWAAVAREKIDTWVYEVEGWDQETAWLKDGGESFLMPDNKRRKIAKRAAAAVAEEPSPSFRSLPVARRLFPPGGSASRNAPATSGHPLSPTTIESLLSPSSTPRPLSKRLDIDLSSVLLPDSPKGKDSKRLSLQYPSTTNSPVGSLGSKRRTIDFAHSPLGALVRPTTSPSNPRPTTSPHHERVSSYNYTGIRPISPSHPTSPPRHTRQHSFNNLLPRLSPTTESVPLPEPEPDADEEVYLGSLPVSLAEHYSTRINFISTALTDLDIETLKSRVLAYRAESITDSSAVITATTLQLLPPLNKLYSMIDVWSRRVQVCRVVPTFLAQLKEAEAMLLETWESDPPLSWYMDVTSLRLETEYDIKAAEEIMDEMWTRQKEGLEGFVMICGRVVDGMLDVLDGREETIPDDWIERLESLEEGLVNWVVDWEEKIREVKDGWWINYDRILAERRLAEERRMAEEQRLARVAEEQRLVEEEASRLEAIRLAEEEALRLEAEMTKRRLSDAKRAEAMRVADEERAKEEEEEEEEMRLTELARVEEEARLAEQARLAEEARQEKEARLEEARLAEEALKAEAARLEAARLEAARLEAAQLEAARLEETRLEEILLEEARLEKVRLEAVRLEEARIVEQARQVEQQRLVEETRLAEESRIAEEAQQAEEARRFEAKQKAEEQRVAEEARLAERIQKAQEAQRTEDARVAEESRKAEDARQVAARVHEEEQLAEAGKSEEAARLKAAEHERLAEETRQSQIQAVEIEEQETLHQEIIAQSRKFEELMLNYHRGESEQHEGLMSLSEHSMAGKEEEENAEVQQNLKERQLYENGLYLHEEVAGFGAVKDTSAVPWQGKISQIEAVTTRGSDRTNVDPVSTEEKQVSVHLHQPQLFDASQKNIHRDAKLSFPSDTLNGSLGLDQLTSSHELPHTQELPTSFATLHAVEGNSLAVEEDNKIGQICTPTHIPDANPMASIASMNSGRDIISTKPQEAPISESMKADQNEILDSQPTPTIVEHIISTTADVNSASAFPPFMSVRSLPNTPQPESSPTLFRSTLMKDMIVDSATSVPFMVFGGVDGATNAPPFVLQNTIDVGFEGSRIGNVVESVQEVEAYARSKVVSITVLKAPALDTPPIKSPGSESTTFEASPVEIPFHHAPTDAIVKDANSIPEVQVPLFKVIEQTMSPPDTVEPQGVQNDESHAKMVYHGVAPEELHASAKESIDPNVDMDVGVKGQSQSKTPLTTTESKPSFDFGQPEEDETFLPERATITCQETSNTAKGFREDVLSSPAPSESSVKYRPHSNDGEDEERASDVPSSPPAEIGTARINSPDDEPDDNTDVGITYSSAFPEFPWTPSIGGSPASSPVRQRSAEFDDSERASELSASKPGSSPLLPMPNISPRKARHVAYGLGLQSKLNEASPLQQVVHQEDVVDAMAVDDPRKDSLAELAGELQSVIDDTQSRHDSMSDARSVCPISPVSSVLDLVDKYSTSTRREGPVNVSSAPRSVSPLLDDFIDHMDQASTIVVPRASRIPSGDRVRHRSSDASLRFHNNLTVDTPLAVAGGTHRATATLRSPLDFDRPSGDLASAMPVTNLTVRKSSSRQTMLPQSSTLISQGSTRPSLPSNTAKRQPSTGDFRSTISKPPSLSKPASTLPRAVSPVSSNSQRTAKKASASGARVSSMHRTVNSVPSLPMRSASSFSSLQRTASPVPRQNVRPIVSKPSYSSLQRTISPIPQSTRSIASKPSYSSLQRTISPVVQTTKTKPSYSSTQRQQPQRMSWSSPPQSPALEESPEVKILKRKPHMSSHPKLVIPDPPIESGRESPVSPVRISPVKDRGTLPSTPIKGQQLDDQLEQKINKILTRLPSNVMMTPSPMKTTTGLPQPAGRLKPLSFKSNIPVSNTAPTAPHPSLNEKTSERNLSRSGAGDIKMYLLQRGDDEAPVKLYVRLVGDRGERVMVRVGGGWADLAEYLKEYASHHSQRQLTPQVDIIETTPHNLRSRASNSSIGSLANSRPSSPRFTPPPREMNMDASNLRTLRNQYSARNLHMPTTPTYERPQTPGSAGRPVSRGSNNNTTTTPSSLHPFRSQSRLSFSDSRPEVSPTPLGLAGPKSRNVEISEEKQAWVDGMLKQVRKASSERFNPPPQALVGEEEFGGLSGGSLGVAMTEFGKVGSTRQMYLSKTPSYAQLGMGRKKREDNA